MHKSREPDSSKAYTDTDLSVAEMSRTPDLAKSWDPWAHGPSCLALLQCDESWLKRVNEPLSDGDLRRLRLSVERGRPFGTEPWTRQTARRLGLESTLRSRGRPRKDPS